MVENILCFVIVGGSMSNLPKTMILFYYRLIRTNNCLVDLRVLIDSHIADLILIFTLQISYLCTLACSLNELHIIC
jgi:hypothetical protein